jgi:6-phospho-3-hexuloisomerase
MFNELRDKTTAEINRALQRVTDQKANELAKTILRAQNIVTCGSGRVGLACKGFAMRLGHLGLKAFTSGDSTLPPLGKDDLLIVASSSGETQTVYDIALAGKKSGAKVVLITADLNSRMGKISDIVITLDAPTKFSTRDTSISIQPMATLFEQSLQVFFDIIVLLLMKKTNQNHDDLWARHSNLD